MTFVFTLSNHALLRQIWLEAVVLHLLMVHEVEAFSSLRLRSLGGVNSMRNIVNYKNLMSA